MTITRSYLREKLQEAGFTYKEARALVSAILDAMTATLKSGKELELPFGTMTPRKPAPKRVYRLGKIVRINTKPKVHFRRED